MPKSSTFAVRGKSLPCDKALHAKAAKKPVSEATKAASRRRLSLKLCKVRVRKPVRKKCSTKHCRNFAAIRKSGYSYGGKCHACRCAIWRQNQPYRNAFVRLKNHARERGIEFTISFEEFRQFAVCTDLINRTGPFGHSLTVDRRDNLKGYVPGNLQPLTRSKNSEKRNKHDQIRMERGHRWAGRYEEAA